MSTYITVYINELFKSWNLYKTNKIEFLKKNIKANFVVFLGALFAGQSSSVVISAVVHVFLFIIHAGGGRSGSKRKRPQTTSASAQLARYQHALPRASCVHVGPCGFDNNDSLDWRGRRRRRRRRLRFLNFDHDFLPCLTKG